MKFNCVLDINLSEIHPLNPMESDAYLLERMAKQFFSSSRPPAPLEEEQVQDDRAETASQLRSELLKESGRPSLFSTAPPGGTSKKRRSRRAPSSAPRVQYPFTTKAQVFDRLQNDTKFVLESLQAVDKGDPGWNASNRPRGVALAAKARDGSLSREELNEARDLVSHYTKQIAKSLRSELISTHPEMAEIASVFNAG